MKRHDVEPRLAYPITNDATRGLEERAFNACPAMKTVFYGGWVFRISDGFTIRANSVNAVDPTIPIAFGLAVYEREAIGLFGLVVASAQRGRGKGRDLTLALLEWGRRAGAHRAYLQVLEDNAVARTLYESLGFRTAYRYHYRVSPISAYIDTNPRKVGFIS